VTGDRPFNVLFLCTGNSARSIMAEALVNHWGGGRFRGHSAGSFPKGEVHPLAFDLLRSLGLPTEGMRSKGWDEFARPGAPEMNAVITVCDQAAGEVCPVWPGRPLTGHWGVFDPTAVGGPEPIRRQAFRGAFRILENRIRLFVSLRPEALDRLSLRRRVDEIGQVGAGAPADGGGAPAS
jgi:arsenate reductase (thioredoxin)